MAQFSKIFEDPSLEQEAIKIKERAFKFICDWLSDEEIKALDWIAARRNEKSYKEVVETVVTQVFLKKEVHVDFDWVVEAAYHEIDILTDLFEKMQLVLKAPIGEKDEDYIPAPGVVIKDVKPQSKTGWDCDVGFEEDFSVPSYPDIKIKGLYTERLSPDIKRKKVALEAALIKELEESEEH